MERSVGLVDGMSPHGRTVNFNQHNNSSTRRIVSTDSNVFEAKKEKQISKKRHDNRILSTWKLRLKEPAAWTRISSFKAFSILGNIHS
jgi:hypothetical protein